jgi:hypothetical protein
MNINTAILGLLSFAGGGIATQIILAIYNILKIKDKLEAGAVGILEIAGTESAKAIKKIKDQALRDKAYKDVRGCADKLDDAYIKGLDAEYLK